MFFKRNAEILTNDILEIKEWQPGDVVVFGTKHIAIIFDKRNKKGCHILYIMMVDILEKNMN